MSIPDPGYGATANVGMPIDEPALDELDYVKPSRVSLSDLPALITPWLLFSVALLPIALAPDLFLGVLALALGGALSLGFLLLSRGKAWQMLSLTCLIAVGFGSVMGFYNRIKYLNTFHFYARSPSYDNVLPTSQPGGWSDAVYLEFSADTRVDAARGAGYQSGDLWCAAPVVSRAQLTEISFWAVGTNCCKARGLFECGDVWNLTKHGGLVVLDASPLLFPEVPLYMKAARVASASYGLPMAEKPIFVRWDVSLEDALQGMWGDAVSFTAIAALAFLGVVPVFVLLLKLFGLALLDPEQAPCWHPEQVELMTFGAEFIPRNYPLEFRIDLFQQRSYWSGEVLLDYVFYTANKHIAFSVLFSHPAHPYTKWRRCFVFLMISLITLFPVAALSQTTGQTGLLRAAFILLATTAPRYFLNWYMMDFTRQELELLGEDGRKYPGVPPYKMFAEFGFVGVSFVLVVIVCAACVMSIQQSTNEPMGSVLADNLDVLGFVFILDPLVDLIAASVGQGDPRGFWSLGFFGKWRAERDQVEGWRMQGLKKGSLPPARPP